MKALVIGLGSMGKRRIRNLKACGVPAAEIVGLDPRADRRQEAQEKYGISCVATLEQGLAQNPERLVISTPPDLHLPYLKVAFERKIPVFCEASVLPEHARELGPLLKNNPQQVYFPSFTMRYFDGPKTVRRLLSSIGRTLAFTYHSGQYLPDWHPWEAIGEYYVSKTETGGCREIVPFELAWLTWALGPVESATGRATRSGTIQAPIDDLYRSLLSFQSGAEGVLTVDVLSREPVRHFHAVGTEGNLVWNAATQNVLITRPGQSEPEVHLLKKPDPEKGYISAESPYVEEIGDFLSWCNNPAERSALELYAQDMHCLEVLEWIEN